MNAVDRMSELRKKLTPEELERELARVDEETLEFFKQAIAQKRDVNAKLRENEATAMLLDRAKALYRDLVSDGIIKIDKGMFPESGVSELYKSHQAVEGVALWGDKVQSRDMRESTIAMAEIYKMVYERIGKEFLRPLAERISGGTVESNGHALRLLNEYRSGAHDALFRSIDGQIRNSLDHQDYILDVRQQIITFEDRGKPPIILSYNKFHRLFDEAFWLTPCMRAAEFEMEEPLVLEVVRRYETVVHFMKKRGMRVMRGDPVEQSISVYELGKYLEENSSKR